MYQNVNLLKLYGSEPFFIEEHFVYVCVYVCVCVCVCVCVSEKTRSFIINDDPVHLVLQIYKPNKSADRFKQQLMKLQ